MTFQRMDWFGHLLVMRWSTWAASPLREAIAATINLKTKEMAFPFPSEKQ